MRTRRRGGATSKRGRGAQGRGTRRFRPFLEQLEERAVPALFTVNTTSDAPALDPNLGPAINESGDVSLRSAIQAANSASLGSEPFHIIEFNIPEGGPKVITAGTLLPALQQPMLINGWSQTGDTNQPGIELVAASNLSLEYQAYGLNIQSSNVEVRGLAITGFRGLYFGSGIAIADGVSNVWIHSNWIGVGLDGLANGNTNGIYGYLVGYSVIGVKLIPHPHFEGVWGISGAGNVISGNLQDGILLLGGFNTIAGNYIGLGADGVTARGNQGDGIELHGSNNLIGGPISAARNLISSNGSAGIHLLGEANYNQILTNYIGTDVTGTLNRGNYDKGILIEGASNNQIGGIAAGEGNLIAFNGQTDTGVSIQPLWDLAATGNSIRGNSIYANPGLGINLLSPNDTPSDQVTRNDVDTPNLFDQDYGPNNLQNFPVLQAAYILDDELEITFNVPASPHFSSYPLDVDFYLADGTSNPNPQGKTYIGSARYTGEDLVYEPSTVPTVSVYLYKTVRLALPAGIAADTRLVATATDALGNTSEFSAPLTVNSSTLAPLNLSILPSSTVTAGTQVELDIIFSGSDPLFPITKTLAWDWGDGSVEELNLESNVVGVATWHTYAAALPFAADRIQVRYVNAVGQQIRGSLPLEVLPGNTAPVIDVPSEFFVGLGNSALGEFQFSDPDENSWTVSINYGMGEEVQSFQASPGVPTQLNHLYQQNGQLVGGDFTVTITVSDGITSATTTTQVHVILPGPVDTAPIIDVPSEFFVGLGDSEIGEFQFSDPDENSWTVSINYGTEEEVQSFQATPGVPIQLAHLHQQNGQPVEGSFTVTITVSDGINSTIATTQVHVLPAEPVVVDSDTTDQPGAITARAPKTPGPTLVGAVTGTLVHTDNSQTTLIVAILPNEVAKDAESETATQLDPDADQVRVITYEVRVVNPGAEDRLVLTFEIRAPADQPPILEYLNPFTGRLEPIRSSTKPLAQNSTVFDPLTGIWRITITLDQTSDPPLTEVTRSVYAVTSIQPLAGPPVTPTTQQSPVQTTLNTTPPGLTTLPIADLLRRASTPQQQASTGGVSGGLITTDFTGSLQQQRAVLSSQLTTLDPNRVLPEVTANQQPQTQVVALALQWLTDIHALAWGLPDQQVQQPSSARDPLGAAMEQFLEQEPNGVQGPVVPVAPAFDRAPVAPAQEGIQIIRPAPEQGPAVPSAAPVRQQRQTGLHSFRLWLFVLLLCWVPLLGMSGKRVRREERGAVVRAQRKRSKRTKRTEPLCG